MAGKNDTSGAKTPTMNANNTPRHKLLAQGQKVDGGANSGGGPKTPA